MASCNVSPNNKTMKGIYFISDAHLGSRALKHTRQQERRLCRFLDDIKDRAQAIYMLGDMFDFWFEYRTVVPKGHVRFLGKIAEIADSGVEVHFFAGNHDMWTFGYLADELGINVNTKPMETEILGKRFFLAHGDGLNDNKMSVRIIQSIFHSKALQFLFKMLPPYIGLNFGYTWSKSNRNRNISNFDFNISYCNNLSKKINLMLQNLIKQIKKGNFFMFKYFIYT